MPGGAHVSKEDFVEMTKQVSMAAGQLNDISCDMVPGEMTGDVWEEFSKTHCYSAWFELDYLWKELRRLSNRMKEDADNPDFIKLLELDIFREIEDELRGQ